MSHPFDPNQLQFYLTIPSPCPYLPDRMERKIFTQLDPLDGPHLNNYLTHAGFRRSQNVIYRPACETCRECRSLRVDVQAFKTGKSFKRTLKRNSDLLIETKYAAATDEQFDLLQRYLNHRHAGGGMSSMVLVDHLTDGMSLVYSFFDPTETHRSLGNFMILTHIEMCRVQDVPYLYLGYWVPDSPKMSYKARFGPAEILTYAGWKTLPTNPRLKHLARPPV